MTDQTQMLPMPSSKPDVTEFLRSRRSNLAKVMIGEGSGPDSKQLMQLLTIAARVPDHRKLAPWRFLIFQGQARTDFGQHLSSAFMKQNPDMPADRAIFEGQRFTRAPLVVAVISSPVTCPRGTPEWEQILSSGAVCFNLCLAAQSMGFGAQWLTEWYAYDADIHAALDMTSSEKVAGFIYIGPIETPSLERARPELKDITQSWVS